jgi:GNAT superfamily N-acetyltransferase
MRVREAQASDVERVVQLCAEHAYPELPWKHVRFDSDALVETLRHIVGSPTGTCILLEEDDGDVVGFALVFLNRYFFSHERYAADLTFYVRPDCRRGWPGVRLIRAMIAYAKSQNVQELLLTVTSGVKVERTVRLIERMGGKVLGRSLSISLKAESQ